jgi:integrase
MAYTQLKDGRWIAYWVEEGKHRRKYFGRGPGAESQARCFHENLGLSKRRPSHKATSPMFGDLAAAYAEGRNFNQNSLELFLIRMERTIFPVFADKPASKITHLDLDNYVRTRRQTVKDSTIRREITDIKAVLNWAASRQPPLIGYNQIHNYKAPDEDNAIIQPPSMEETAAIMSHAVPHLVRVITLAYYLGLRPGAVELLSLKWRQVNWENNTILIISAHKGGPEKRVAPLHGALRQILQEWYEEDKKTMGIDNIISYRGRPIKSIKHAWKTALKAAGITRRIRPYDLRHQMITRALEAGADIKALSEVVGSSPETLRKHYQHVSSELKRQTVAMIPEIRMPILKKTPAN